MVHHLIFEGAELSGKSWIMSEVYKILEPKYNQQKVVLDGCHWFNCDIGIYGTDRSQFVNDCYVNIFNELEDRNIIVEKFYLSDIIYNRLHLGKELNYQSLESNLQKLNFKTILCTFPEDEELLKKRIEDRLRLYPHYSRILQTPDWYIKQQREYIKEIKKSRLPYLIIEATQLPDQNIVNQILTWIGENK